MYKGFWERYNNPIIGLAPMDGVSDAAFRFITDKYGKPDILFTEFTSVDGIAHGAVQLLHAFIHHKTSTPTVAQIYGPEPKEFYNAAIICAELAFDGVDINMGCPDKSVSGRGAGAGLILKPETARQIMKTVKTALKDWSEGRKLEDLNLDKKIYNFVKSTQKKFELQSERKLLPLSVKTRIGYEDIVTIDWIKNLLEEEPAAITLHGRTLRQLYTGLANWDEIGKAAELTSKTETLLLGNGDVKSLEDAQNKIKTYKTNGALIGRASFGNPWVFNGETIDFHKRLDVALEHCEKFMEFTPDLYFLSLRKHLAWYCKGFTYASEVRNKFMQVRTMEDVQKIIAETKYI